MERFISLLFSSEVQITIVILIISVILLATTASKYHNVGIVDRLSIANKLLLSTIVADLIIPLSFTIL